MRLLVCDVCGKHIDDEKDELYIFREREIDVCKECYRILAEFRREIHAKYTPLIQEEIDAEVERLRKEAQNEARV